jgi:protein phosphatase
MTPADAGDHPEEPDHTEAAEAPEGREVLLPPVPPDPRLPPPPSPEPPAEAAGAAGAAEDAGAAEPAEDAAGAAEDAGAVDAAGPERSPGRRPRPRRDVITVPELSLVVLVGMSGSGKSTFAARHFRRTEVLSSDACRGLVSDDENDQAATRDAFDVLHHIAGKRLAAGRLTVVDATNVQREARGPLVELARAHDVLPVAIVLDVPELVCLERNRLRPDRDFGDHVIRRQRQQLRRSLRGLAREGFRRVTVLGSPEEIEAVRVEREPAWTDKRHERGPFDIVGDVHGCHDELVTLLTKLGYEVDADGTSARHPAGRRAFFVGDLVDRGPDVPGVLRRVMGMVAEGSALAVAGNHEDKLLRALRGRKVKVSHGLAQSLEQLEAQPEELRARVVEFLDSLVSHYVLDDGQLVVAHAGMKEAFQGRASGRVRAFALYGETTGEIDELGLPVRYPWADDYRGRAVVVYGHTPVPEPRWVNNTICIDTGCVFGGSLTALRYPEKELVAVPATQVHYEPVRPLAARDAAVAPPGADAGPPAPSHRGGTDLPAGERPGDLLDVDDVMGKRRVETRLLPSVTVREENAVAALEVMSRFAVDPRWLVYLPPTMAPTATTEQPGLLEHPAEAFAAFRADGVDRVICEEKHMGSRAVVVVCRDAEVAARRFGVPGDGAGTVYTRTGRPFFGADPATGTAVLDRVRDAVGSAGLWDELATDWLVLDAELMPWSAKAVDLLRFQYAPVAAAGQAATGAAVEALAAAVARGVDIGPVHERLAGRRQMLADYAEAYGRYCWPVATVDELRLAPFAVLAGEGELLAARSHGWHMEVAARLADADADAGSRGAGAEGREGVLMATDYRIVDLSDRLNEAEATQWWQELTAAGGEGMVVKPLDAIVRGGRHGLVQPGIKCRGREYLRIIYGPEYTEPANLERLRQRGIGHKRSLAQRELALGVEALERFVAGEPLYRVHECVFGVLALESEPVDPRL